MSVFGKLTVLNIEFLYNIFAHYYSIANLFKVSFQLKCRSGELQSFHFQMTIYASGCFFANSSFQLLCKALQYWENNTCYSLRESVTPLIDWEGTYQRTR